MRTSLNIENKINMITEMRGDSVFQVLEYDSLKGGNSLELAVKLNQMKEANIKLQLFTVSVVFSRLWKLLHTLVWAHRAPRTAGCGADVGRALVPSL